jgi:septum formation protein
VQLILASTSRYRKELLEKLNFPFLQMASNVDEDQYKNKGHSPLLLAQKLAKAKALEVAKANPASLIIGSDQVCCLNDKIYSKAGSREMALKILTELSGKTHQLHTSVSLICIDRQLEINFHETIALKMRNLNLKEIETYLDLDQPLDCAGCYKIESHGVSLFEEINCRDHTAIIGLPLIELNQHLLKLLPRN